MRLFSYLLKSKFGKTILGLPLLFLLWLLLIGSDDRPGFFRVKVLPFVRSIGVEGGSSGINAYDTWTFENQPVGITGDDSSNTSARIDTLTLGNNADDVDGLQIFVDADGGTGNVLISSDGLTFSGFSGGVDIDGAFTAGSVASDGVVSGTTITASTAFELGDDDYLGLGVAAGRIVFDDDVVDEVNIMAADVGINVAKPWNVSGYGGVTIGGTSGGFVAMGVVSTDSVPSFGLFLASTDGLAFSTVGSFITEQVRFKAGNLLDATDAHMLIQSDGDVLLIKQDRGFSIVNNTVLMNLQGFGDDNTTDADAIGGQIEVIATGTWTDGAEDAKMVLNAANNGVLNANQFVLNTDGSVLIASAGGVNYGHDAGGDDAYVVTITGIAAYTEGLIVCLAVDFDNDGACTLNINSIGAGDIKTQNGSDPGANWLDANSTVILIYDGANFVLLTPDANPA